MIKKTVCSNCGSGQIYTKAWVSLNDASQIDYSLSEENKDEDHWCKDCNENWEVEEVPYCDKGDTVLYEGKYYTVEDMIHDPSEFDEDTEYVICNENETITVKAECLTFVR